MNVPMPHRAVHRWAATVAALAAMPDVIARLRADHRPDPGGRCRACTEPGQGIPGAAWPCVLAVLAQDAHHVRVDPGSAGARADGRST